MCFEVLIDDSLIFKPHVLCLVINPQKFQSKESISFTTWGLLYVPTFPDTSWDVTTASVFAL